MKTLLRALGSVSLAAALAVGSSADTIYMKNGSVIRGTVVGYGNGEFTVQLTGGTRSRATLAGDEIDRIEFEAGPGSSAGSAPANTGGYDRGGGSAPSNAGAYDPGQQEPYGGGAGSEPPDDAGGGAADPAPMPSRTHDTGSAPPTSTSGGALEAGESDVTVDPKADWTNTRFRVSRGSRIRITASGSVRLDPAGKRASGPGGIDSPDRDKLMPNRPTGSLIAVVGDDNDDFVFVGSQAEFVASRAGYLFLSVNEGYLRDNSGTYVAHIVVMPPAAGGSIARGPSPSGSGGSMSRPAPGRPNPPPSTHSTQPPVTRSDDSGSAPAPLDPAPSTAGATVAREGDVVVQSNLDWTNTKIRVQRGNVVRVRATGSVQLGGGMRATPAGVDAPDNDKLIPNRPTGSLIAVVGDDNDDFLFIGPESEFVAQHDGVLFLSVNEGNLKDNSGTFSAHVTVLQTNAAASGGTASARPAPSNRPAAPAPRTGGSSSTLPRPVVDDTLGGAAPAAAAPKPIPASVGANGGSIDLVVPAKSDWTSTAIVLKKGSKVRITATGSAKLDAGGKASTTPAGVTSTDPHKLMKDKPTGGLVAVIGDDNSDYVFVGAATEFTAQRDGLLFLGINEGELFDNTGSFTVHIVVEPPRKK